MFFIIDLPLVFISIVCENISTQVGFFKKNQIERFAAAATTGATAAADDDDDDDGSQ